MENLKERSRNIHWVKEELNRQRNTLEMIVSVILPV